MALFIFCGSNTSFPTRFYILALIALVLVCFCSRCSSSAIVSPVIDTDSLSNNIDESNDDDEMTYGLQWRLPLATYARDQPILPANDPFIQLLLKSTLNQPNYRHHKQNNKRYTSQSFHAMRG